MILFFNPIFFDKVWGGGKIEEFLNFPISKSCGECWGISAHKNGESTIKNGIHKGKTLKELFDNHKNLFGNFEGLDFPILVKIIDAKKDLSIQVHPNDNYAKQLNAYGKTECWYILDSDKKASLIIGHTFKSKEELECNINKGDLIKKLKRINVKKDDFFFIDSGTLHSICSGTFLLEVQQSSDITFRIFDYNRLDKGKLRKLHTKEALEVITIPDNKINKNLINKHFDFTVFNNNNTSSYTSHIHGDYLVILEGIGKINEYDIKKGDFLMVSSNFEYFLKGELTIQKTNF